MGSGITIETPLGVSMETLPERFDDKREIHLNVSGTIPGSTHLGLRTSIPHSLFPVYGCHVTHWFMVLPPTLCTIMHSPLEPSLKLMFVRDLATGDDSSRGPPLRENVPLAKASVLGGPWLTDTSL